MMPVVCWGWHLPAGAKEPGLRVDVPRMVCDLNSGQGDAEGPHGRLALASGMTLAEKKQNHLVRPCGPRAGATQGAFPSHGLSTSRP